MPESSIQKEMQEALSTMPQGQASNPTLFEPSYMHFMKAVNSRFTTYAGMSFDNFNCYNDKLAKLKAILERSEFKDFPISLLSKQVGCGKTHLAVSLLKRGLAEGLKHDMNSLSFISEDDFFGWAEYHVPSYLCINETKLLGYFERAFKDPESTEADLINTFASVRLLLIDDIFSNRITDFSIRIIFSIIDQRCEIYKLPTIFTSNLVLEEIGRLVPRIASRMQNNNCFVIDGIEDYRKRRVT